MKEVRPYTARLAPLRRFLADLDEGEADRFITQLATLIAYMRDEPFEER